VLESFTLSSDRLPPPGEWEPAGGSGLQFTLDEGRIAKAEETFFSELQKEKVIAHTYIMYK